MTRSFEVLKNRIFEIEEAIGSLLPIDPTLQSEAKCQDLIKSLVLLCHAEFEEYFEQIAKGSITAIQSELENLEIKESHLLSIGKQYESMTKLIDANNGIKLDNLKKFLPLTGFDLSSLDDTYIDRLNSFAKKRGRIAHRGQTGIVLLLSYTAEKSEIDLLVTETENSIDVFFENEYGI